MAQGRFIFVMLEIDNVAIEKPLGFILKILRIMDDGAVNVVKSFVGDRTGDYRYLGEIKKGMHIVSYMFTDDASTEDGAFLAVGTVQYYVVSGVECRFADDEESLWAMRSPIPEILDDPNNKVASDKGLNIDFSNVLEKYAQQKGGYSCPDLTSYAEDTGKSEEYWREYQAWMNDGKPTGIESDEQFYELQKQAYRRILVDLD